MAIRIISFDMDGTLVSSRYTDQVWLEGMPLLYARRHGLDLEEARRKVYDEYMSVGTGDLRWYSMEHWLEYFDIPEVPGQLLESYRDQVEVYPETEEVLRRLGERFDLVVTTNGAREFLDMQLSTLDGYFKATFSTTGDFGLVKSPEAYRELCRRLQARPEEVMHVGDNLSFDYQMAREAGLQALYLDREGMNRGEDTIRDLRGVADRLTGDGHHDFK
ncbi:MAG: HAD family hydrolase [Methanosarcinales archaeon]|nr:HAD family hydrolase [Methanosarcinales archaeon]